MKAEIKGDGILYLQPESETEAYALGCWIDEAMNEVAQPMDRVPVIEVSSLHIGNFHERRPA